MKYYLAVDIGASSGRHILGHIKAGKLILEETYRFENHIDEQNGSLVWDIESLVANVKTGIALCGRLGKIPCSVSVDTWGVDYVLLDKDKNVLPPVYSYRDVRNEAAVDAVESIISQNELYRITGIQMQSFNTIYQLYCDKLSGKLDNAEYFMMMPDYIQFCLTGEIFNEYTNATTTGLVNAARCEWGTDIVNKLNLPEKIFKPLKMPETKVGGFTDEMKFLAGFDCNVMLCPSHDTASAVAACPLKEDSIYISSGTWSLIGTESAAPIITDRSRTANFTNEGGIEQRYRFLKNYMGMWLLQNIRRNLRDFHGIVLSYDDMMQLAMQSDFVSFIDVNDKSFVAPENMIQAIKDYLHQPDIQIGDLLNCVYHSLAKSYHDAVAEIEQITGKKIGSVNIVGGGSCDSYLNRLTAAYTGKHVFAGPKETTAAGNIISQIMADTKIPLSYARRLIENSFDIKETENDITL